VFFFSLKQRFGNWILEVEVKLRPTVSRLVYHGVVLPSGTHDQIIFFCLENWGFLDVERPLWTENGSVINSYSCFWALPEQSLPGLSPAGLRIICYCLIWHSRPPCFYPPGTGWPSYSPGHWVTFSSPLTTRRATVEVF
jgi:hypothetical protein